VDADHSDLCYRCGLPDHKAAGCSAEPRCPYCADRGLKTEHRYGGEACASLRPEKSKKEGKRVFLPPQKEAGKKRADPPTSEQPSDTTPVTGPMESREEAIVVE